MPRALILIPALAILLLACGTAPPKTGKVPEYEDPQAMPDTFPNIHELMEWTGNQFTELVDDSLGDHPDALEKIHFNSLKLAQGFSDMQTRLKVRGAEADWIRMSKETEDFWRRVADVAETDRPTLRDMFRDARQLDEQFCTRCHDNYQ